MPTTTHFERTTPEAVGIPSAAILEFVRALEEHDHPLDATHGFMVLRHGKVAAEGWWSPFRPGAPHMLYSLSKTFTSTAIGIAVAEGLLTVDDPVLQFFPDDAPAAPGPNLRAMRVRNLLAMNTGHHEDTTNRVWRGEDDNWARAFLALPVEHDPGTWFVYNTAATYMLSAIITRLTGEPLVDYLGPRLFDPLGIANPAWDADPRGISLGGSGLHVTTADIARFGQLYLQRGLWDGRQVVPAAWIDEATQAHSDNSNTQSNPDWTVGYGYQLWRCRHNAYRADGAFGQYCVVMPEQDAVIAINSGVRDLQAVLDKVWTHLLPAMGQEALPEDANAHQALAGKLGSLTLPQPQGAASSPRAETVSGTTFALDANDLGLEQAALTFTNDGATLVLATANGHQRVEVGHGAWRSGTSGIRGQGDEDVAAIGAWTGDDRYEAWVCATEDAYGAIYRVRFDGDALHLEVDPSVAWASPTVTAITGHATSA